MARYFQATPVAVEPPVPKTSKVWCGNDKASGHWTKALPTFTKQTDRIDGVLNHMIQSNDIVLGRLRDIRNRLTPDFKPLAPGVGHRPRIGIQSRRTPTKGTHPGNKPSVAAPHVQQS